MSKEEAETLVQRLENLRENPPSAILENEELRRRFREAAYGVSLSVHTPSDSVHLIAYGALYSSMARIGVDTKLFELLVSSAAPLSSEGVSEKTGIDLVLTSKSGVETLPVPLPWAFLNLRNRATSTVLPIIRLAQSSERKSIHCQQCYQGACTALQHWH